MGENTSPVRTEAIALMVALLQLMGASSFTAAIDPVWSDKNWRVRQGMAQVFGAAAGQFRLPKLTIRERDAVLGRLVGLLEDSNRCVWHTYDRCPPPSTTHTRVPQQCARVCAGLHRDHDPSHGPGGQADRAAPQRPPSTHARD